MSEKRNGRPTLAEQSEIERQLWPYFEQRYKPDRVAYETGINVKTVRRYFRIWHEKYISVQGPEFFKNCRLSNGRTILELDNEILEMKKRSAELDVAIKSSGPIHKKRWLYSEYRKTKELILKLYLEKNNLECTPTTDTIVQTETDDLFKQKMGTDHVAA